MKSNSLQDTATNALRDVSQHVAEAGTKISEFVVENAEAARDRVTDAYDKAKQGTAAGAKHVRITVRRHPLESVLIAFGAGIVLGTISGLLCGRRR